MRFGNCWRLWPAKLRGPGKGAGVQARLVIITGLSGAGRSEAMRVFEDLGYFCVDNLPPSLIPKFAELVQKSPEVRGAALVMDIRGGIFFAALKGALEAFDGEGIGYQMLYLEADEETLIQRYKLSRRRHPLETGARLAEALRQEREALKELKGRADVVMDTSGLSPAQLRQRITELFRLDGGALPFQVRMVSFGFKHGLPKDADLVFDVRFLPNPHYVDVLRHKTGRDPDVVRYVLQFPQAQETLRRLQDLLEFLMPQFQQEGKPQVTIAVGCTGGQHRSVVFADQVAERLRAAGHTVTVDHRDLTLADLGEG